MRLFKKLTQEEREAREAKIQARKIKKALKKAQKNGAAVEPTNCVHRSTGNSKRIGLL